ncbi:AfsR/SARP family transcriptional regulator [Streptomyces benahoarensis]|uniref:Transcriptional regulator n=1 Tax=Streptomyces benahoarensis TaxID=2595054 RepID=A0A553ZQT7_9ACTN|nr:BTAD domain-containing putative transcriptional regulator [Streptomyces benahoarensis]TSB31530.1 transcriptional regulator [Streptomyces benahoarensis]TSB43646.1 transcriptional regulator [Streptomyces benahoarensis]
MRERLSFKILGPLSMIVGGRSTTVGGARQRTILSLLILNPGRIVPMDTLVEVVWNGRPPTTARTQVAICIAALRKKFKAEGVAEDIVITAHPGYLLNTEGHEVDSVEFTKLVGAAQQAVKEQRLDEAAQFYQSALDLWRGPALDGVTGQLVEEEARRLEELRLNAYDDHTAVQLELGNHQATIPELAAVVREQPLRERTRYHLMLAEYRSGRRADAMATFRDARRQLVEELGLEPGPDLQELHDAILRDDPALTPAARISFVAPKHQPRTTAVHSSLPPDIPGFVGRVHELAALSTLVADEGTRQAVSVSLITGAAGVGKTGLALHWAHRVGDQFPDGRLFADLQGYESGDTLPISDVLSRFLRSLGVSSQQIPTELEERCFLYRNILADRRVLLVLDNVRTYAQIQPLLPSAGESCVLVTSREQLEGLVAWPAEARVHLGPLPDPDAMELLGKIVGTARISAAPAESARLVELCDKLPLALRIAAARLASKPHWTVRHLANRLDDERRRLDELSQGESQVRVSFELSYRHLPDDAARLYRLLGLLDIPDFTAWVGAALLDTDVLDAEGLIEYLVDAQLLVALGTDATGCLRYRFQNLLRLYARERAHDETPCDEHRAALDRVFRTFLTITEEAHRRDYGGDFTVIHSDVPRRTVDPAFLDDLLAVSLDWFEAERLNLLAVIEQAARAGMDDLAWDLTASMVTLFETRNYVENWRVCCEHALAAAREAGNTRGQAAMLHDLGAVELRLRRIDMAADRFHDALRLYEATDDEHGQALTRRNIAITDRIRGDLDSAMTGLETARATFRTVGDHSSEAHALNNMAQIALDRGQPDSAVRLALESIRISQSIGAGGERGLAQGSHRLARAYLAQGQLVLAEETFLEVVRIVKEKSDQVGLAYALLGVGETSLAANAPQQADAVLNEALEISRRIDSPLVEGQINLALGESCRRQGRYSASRTHLLAAQQIFTSVGSPPWQERALLELDALDSEPVVQSGPGNRISVPGQRAPASLHKR